jgi:hypothetical protein
MSSRCASPVAFDALVAYWAGDLASIESEAVEEHLMGCGSCTATSAGVAAVALAIRAQIPPIVTPEIVANLRARGLRIIDNAVKPGERRPVAFAADVDVLLHRLGGLDLSRVLRVDVTVKVEETGDVIFQSDDAPFDRDAGEVLIACQRHFSAFPPNIVFEIRARDASRDETVRVYTVPHVYG